MKDDPELEDWLAGLSGQRGPRSAQDEAAALRQIILSHRTVLDSDESAAADRLIAHLRKSGALSPTVQSRRVAATRVWAIAASVAFVALGGGLLFKMSSPGLHEYPQEELRGLAGGLNLLDAHPRERAAQVIRELQAVGVSARLLPETERAVIEASVTTEQLPAFAAWMEAHAGAARAAGDYRIVIVPP